MKVHMDDPNMFHLFKCMNLCQECIVIPFNTPDSAAGKDFSYHGQSLDEICLLDFVYDVNIFGYFKQKESDTIKL